MKSEIGENALLAALMVANQHFNDRLVAAYAIGSLGHGGFSPGASDIDLALILDEEITPHDSEIVSRISEEVKASGIPLSDRLSVFWSSWKSLQNPNPLIGRFPTLDRLDLIQHGRLLQGVDQKNKVKTPTKKELIIEGAEFALLKLSTLKSVERILNPSLLIQDGGRAVTKAVLFPVRFLFTAATGEVGTNEAAVEYWIKNHPSNSVTELVSEAYQWRDTFNPERAAQLLPGNLVCIYNEFLNCYAGHMSGFDHSEISRDLHAWKERLINCPPSMGIG